MSVNKKCQSQHFFLKSIACCEQTSPELLLVAVFINRSYAYLHPDLPTSFAELRFFIRTYGPISGTCRKYFGKFDRF